MRSPALLVLALAACTGGTRSWRAAAAARPPAAEPGIAPRPFTADDLRRGLPVGTDIRYRIEEKDKPPVVLHWHVTAADATTCTMSSQVLSEDGKVLADEGEKTTAFADLVKHATFPAARTVRSSGTVEVPAGRFESIDYVVTTDESGARVVKTLHFAKKLPGPPVLMVTEKDGVVVQIMSLLSRT